MHYVFAGAEKPHNPRFQLRLEKFGIRILEGYGVTVASALTALNTPMAYRTGTVGRMVPGIEYHIEPVPGIRQGGRLEARGPNVMLGYLLRHAPGVVQPPSASHGKGWHDSGDIISMDGEGFLTIRGRTKRFTKIAGEMVSLASAEELASSI